MNDMTSAWDNKGNIVIGNDVWIGYEAVIMSGVTIGDGAIQSGNISLIERREKTWSLMKNCKN